MRVWATFGQHQPGFWLWTAGYPRFAQSANARPIAVDTGGTCQPSPAPATAPDAPDVAFQVTSERWPDCSECDDLADDAAPCRYCGLGMWGGR